MGCVSAARPPTEYRFAGGKQIRITVAFADADNFDTAILNPAPTLQLLRGAGHRERTHPL